MGIKNTISFPEDVYKGMRAFNTQSYTESNIKLGLQYEASRYLESVTVSSPAYSVFKTGSKPVSLKARRLSYTGDGIIADIHKGAVYSGGTPGVYFNNNDINPVDGEMEVLANVEVTDEGTKCFASDYYIGNTSKQGKGSTGSIYGNEYILQPNTEYLFIIRSISGNQGVSAFVSWYEGPLDLPD